MQAEDIYSLIHPFHAFQSEGQALGSKVCVVAFQPPQSWREKPIKFND
jgi:hypothetical protein